MSNILSYADVATGNTGPSKSIWHDCDVLKMIRDPGYGYYFFEDFLSVGQLKAGTNTLQYATYCSDTTNHSVAPIATAVGGVLRLAIDSSAGGDEECMLSFGGTTGVMGKISSTAPKKLWFETRVAFGQIVTTSAYVGLTEEGCAADSALADAGTGIASKDKVGFQTLEAAPSTLECVHNDATGDVKDTATTSAFTGTLVASTWYRLGIKFDGTRTFWYIDGLPHGSTNIASSGVLPTATDFPNGEELTPTFGIKGHAGSAAVTLDIDWVRFAQLR